MPRQPDEGRPTVAGVAGGVGTTTVATAIGGRDRGLFVGRPVDVLVCRASGESLVRCGRAAQIVSMLTGAGPLVVVSPLDAHGPSRPLASRMRLLEPHVSGVLVLPYVRRWRELAVPLDEVRDLLHLEPTEVARPLRRYAAAAAQIRAALDLRSPTPARPAPPHRAGLSTPPGPQPGTRPSTHVRS